MRFWTGKILIAGIFLGEILGCVVAYADDVSPFIPDEETVIGNTTENATASEEASPVNPLQEETTSQLKLSPPCFATPQ
jgi:hypothetical protein